MLVNGEFTTDGNLCSELQITDSYDSREFQIESPIVYFEGTNDAATPMDQARHHFDNQLLSKKSFVTVEEAGHMPLQTSLFGCKTHLWNSIIENQEVSSADLKSCAWAWPLSVENR